MFHVLVDLDRANQRANVAERELELLREQLAELKNDNIDNRDADDVTEQQNNELRVQLQAKEQEVVQLVEDVQKTNKILSDTEQKYEKKLAEVQDKNDALCSELEEATTKLQSQADYQSVKKDLSIMKSLYFPSHNSEEEDGRPLGRHSIIF